MQPEKEIIKYFYRYHFYILKDFIDKTSHMIRFFQNYFKNPNIKELIHRITILYQSEDEKNQVARIFPASKLPENYLDNIFEGFLLKFQLYLFFIKINLFN